MGKQPKSKKCGNFPNWLKIHPKVKNAQNNFGELLAWKIGLFLILGIWSLIFGKHCLFSCAKKMGLPNQKWSQHTCISGLKLLQNTDTTVINHNIVMWRALKLAAGSPGRGGGELFKGRECWVSPIQDTTWPSLTRQKDTTWPSLTRKKSRNWWISSLVLIHLCFRYSSSSPFALRLGWPAGFTMLGTSQEDFKWQNLS